MDHRTTSAAALLALSIALSGCSSTVGGDPGTTTTPAPSGEASPSSGASPTATPDGTDFTRYLLRQEQLPPGFEISTDNPTAREDYVRSLTVPEGVPVTIDPPQCLGYDPYGDLDRVAVVEAMEVLPPVTLAQAAGPAGGGLGALRERASGCGTTTATSALPNGEVLTSRSTTTVLPDPAVGADEVVVLTVGDATEVGGDTLTTTQTLGFATVGSVVVGVRAIPIGPDPVDPAVVPQVLTAAVAKVRG